MIENLEKMEMPMLPMVPPTARALLYTALEIVQKKADMDMQMDMSMESQEKNE